MAEADSGSPRADREARFSCRSGTEQFADVVTPYVDEVAPSFISIAASK